MAGSLLEQRVSSGTHEIPSFYRAAAPSRRENPVPRPITNYALFFDVRPYLQAEFYIFAKAIGPKVHSGLTCDDHDLLLKLAGYALGAVAVDQLLAHWADPPIWPVSLAQLDGPALETS
jgi:hypothetical protein